MKKEGRLNRNVMRLLCALVAVGALVPLTGCATIVDGGPAIVAINSTPSGAGVRIQDTRGRLVASHQTPCTIRLSRYGGYFSGAAYTVLIEKQGYNAYQAQISSSLNAGWYIVGNLFFGGVLGWVVVDPLSGAMWDLSPVHIHATLSKQTE